LTGAVIIGIGGHLNGPNLTVYLSMEETQR